MSKKGVKQIIDQLRPVPQLSKEIDVPISTILSWMSTHGTIRQKYHKKLIAVARKRGIELTKMDFYEANE